MITAVEKKLNQSIWWVLQEIKKESLVRHKDHYIKFVYRLFKDDSAPSVENQRLAIKFLENHNAIKIVEEKYSPLIPIAMNLLEPDSVKPIILYLEILEPKFNQLYRRFAEKDYKETTKKEKQRISENPLKLLIDRDGQGEFYYNGRKIKFKGKETIYYKIFVCLFEKSGIEGFCSFETIDEYLIENGWLKIMDEAKKKKRIQNGVSNLFRFTENLGQTTPDGKKIIEPVAGKGFNFHNPQI